jgi:hypothetical protein
VLSSEGVRGYASAYYYYGLPGIRVGCEVGSAALQLAEYARPVSAKKAAVIRELREVPA